jgi:tRNA pseudouridine55 synthase
MHGALLIDKPCGPTSHDVVAFVRRTLKTPRAGHTGTLDPLATGLLVLLVGQATRLAQFLSGDDKEYVADIRLGLATPTYDAASLAEVGGRGAEVGENRHVQRPTDTELEQALDRFRGSFLQDPPPFSAKKIASVPAYEKARKNEQVELKPVAVSVRELQVLPRRPAANLQPPTSDVRDATLVRLRVVSSPGFYVRSLAHDLGQALGCGAHLEALRRIRAGRFRVDEALTLDRVEAEGAGALVTMNTLLADMPPVRLSVEGLRRASHGNDLGPTHVARPDASGSESARVRLLDDAGEVVAVAERRADGLLHPLVVLR